jgi:phosphoglycolate phosphatase-like HAD superfamily hydrolase
VKISPLLLDKYDVIIFDCDGVLLDVNLLKCEAFGKAVEDYPSAIIEDFVNYCKKTFGISRYVKFKAFLSDFAKEDFDENKYNNLLRNYAAICKEIYCIADITPSCEKLLFKLINDNKNLYVASGSDEEELNEAFNKRNLNNYFKKIYGSPKTKLECTSVILKYNINKRIVFIGDAISDMKTAKEYNIDFIYMSKYTVQSEKQDKLCREGAIKVIDTLEDLI